MTRLRAWRDAQLDARLMHPGGTLAWIEDNRLRAYATWMVGLPLDGMTRFRSAIYEWLRRRGIRAEERERRRGRWV